MNRVTGGGAPARLWRDFMQAAHKGLPARSLLKPVGGARPPKAGENLFDRLWKSLGAGGSPATNNNSDKRGDP